MKLDSSELDGKDTAAIAQVLGRAVEQTLDALARARRQATDGPDGGEPGTQFAGFSTEVIVSDTSIFMRGGAMVMAGMGAAPAWLARAADASSGKSAGGKRKVLVAIFQRGAADGLNVVVPFAETLLRIAADYRDSGAKRTEHAGRIQQNPRSIWTGASG